MDILDLQLFGTPQIKFKNKPLMMDTRKATAMLIYLAMTKETHSRDSLAAMFWPENDQIHARGALRRTLSALRSAVGDNLLNTNRQTVKLKIESGIKVDVWEFRRLRSHSKSEFYTSRMKNAAFLTDLEAAVELYRGDFLEGFSLRDSLAFDNWQFFEGETLRSELAETLDQLIEGLIQDNQFQKAIHNAQRRLTLDPLYEPVHRTLMRLYAWTNQKSAAIRQYRMCLNILDQELGVSPVEETIELYQQIQSQLPFPPPEEYLQKTRPITTNFTKTAQHSIRQSEFILPLVERENELNRMLALFGRHQEGGRLIVLEGEAGIGKTRLAEEFSSQLQMHGVTTLISRCFEGESELVYGSFTDLLRKGLKTQKFESLSKNIPTYWLSEASRLLPEISGFVEPEAPASLDHLGSRSRFYEGICQMLRFLCSRDRTGLVILDDVQWMDAASLDLLFYLIRRLGEINLCILLTWQSEEVSPDHPLRRLLVETQRMNRSIHIHLKRLSQVAVEELSLQNQDFPDTFNLELSKRLYNETDGSPLMLSGYLRAIKDGEIDPFDSEWQIPVNLQEILRARLAKLNDTARQLLSAASVIGRSFDFYILHEVSGRSIDETVTGIELLIRQGFLQESTYTARDGGQTPLIYDFSHPHLRTLIYSDTSRIRRRLIHARIAETLVKIGRQQGNTEAVASLIAHHYYQAGEEQNAAEFYRLGADHARSLYANQEALNFYQNSMAAGYSDTTSLHIFIGDMLVLLGRYKEALHHYETAASIDSIPAGDVEQKMGIVYQRLGEWELSVQYLQSALEQAEAQKDVAKKASILSELSLTFFFMGEFEKAQDLSSRSLFLSRKSKNPDAVAQSYNLMGILAREQKKLEQAISCLEKSLEAARSSGEISLQLAALNNLALVYSDRSDYESAIVHTVEALNLCSRIGDEHRKAALLNNMADLYHAVGEDEKSMDYLKQAVKIFIQIGSEAGTEMVQIWNLREW